MTDVSSCIEIEIVTNNSKSNYNANKENSAAMATARHQASAELRGRSKASCKFKEDHGSWSCHLREAMPSYMEWQDFLKEAFATRTGAAPPSTVGFEISAYVKITTTICKLIAE